MKKSVLMFLGFFLSVGSASAVQIDSAFMTELAQIQCAAKGQPWKILQAFPALVDNTLLTLVPHSKSGGRFEYRAEHAGLTGGSCQIRFKGEFQYLSEDLIEFVPDRSSFKTSNGGFDPPCRTLRVDQRAQFRVKRIEGRTNKPVYLQLEGADTANLCGGAQRGYQVRLQFVILGQE